ncbi:MAG: TetR/AcrR family transcriptional regulator [Haloechinothrix sp.]
MRGNAEDRKIDPRIWDAAIKLFASKGFAATGIREIADEAGLSVSAMYYYVDNKEDLLLKIMRDAQQRLVEAGRLVAAQFSEPAAGLAALVQLHVVIYAQSPLEARVVDSELRALGDKSRRETVVLRDNYESLWNDVLERGLDGGVFTFRDLRATRLALLEMCTGVSAWFSPDGPLGVAELAHEFADLALALVRASSDTGPIMSSELDLPSIDWYIAAFAGQTAPAPEAAHATS